MTVIPAPLLVDSVSSSVPMPHLPSAWLFSAMPPRLHTPGSSPRAVIWPLGVFLSQRGLGLLNWRYWLWGRARRLMKVGKTAPGVGKAGMRWRKESWSSFRPTDGKPCSLTSVAFGSFTPSSVGPHGITRDFVCPNGLFCAICPRSMIRARQCVIGVSFRNAIWKEMGTFWSIHEVP